MSEWVEERCEAIRLALRIQGFPTELDLLRLVDWLEGCVVLRHRNVKRARCLHHEDGRKVITMPAKLTGQVFSLKLSHELGHVLTGVGMGELLRQEDPENARARRLAKLWDAKDEYLAQSFVLSWFLPSALVAQIPDLEQLALESGCDLEMILERKKRLRGRVFELQEMPRWCAAREYHTVAVSHSRHPHIFVARGGSCEPVYMLPVICAEFHAAAMQVNADLLALNSPEFELKYADFHCLLMAEQISVAQLRQWAARGQ